MSRVLRSRLLIGLSLLRVAVAYFGFGAGASQLYHVVFLFLLALWPILSGRLLHRQRRGGVLLS